MSITDPAVSRTYQREWKRQERIRNPDLVRSRYRKWRLKSLDYVKVKYKEWSKDNPARILFLSTKHGAKKRGIQFELKFEDLVIPDRCPVLGIPIGFNGMTGRMSSPSIDRFDNSKGYTKENIRVISWRANHLKSDGTAEEIEMVLRYMRGDHGG